MSDKASFDFGVLSAQFKNLNPNDVATWPIVPRLAALLGVFIATLALGWWFVWNDQLTQLRAEEDAEQKLKTEYVEKKKKSVNLELYLQQLNEIDQTFGALLKQLPNKSEMDALLIEINQAGLGRGLQFELFKPGSELQKDFYAELPILIKLTGNYHEFGAFASDVAKLPRIVTLNDMTIANKDGRLTMDATVKTFRYLDQEEIAKAKAAAKAAQKGGAKKGAAK